MVTPISHGPTFHSGPIPLLSPSAVSCAPTCPSFGICTVNDDRSSLAPPHSNRNTPRPRHPVLVSRAEAASRAPSVSATPTRRAPIAKHERYFPQRKGNLHSRRHLRPIPKERNSSGRSRECIPKHKRWRKQAVMELQAQQGPEVLARVAHREGPRALA